MDGAAIAGAATGVGGIVVSLVSLWKARKAETDQIGLRQLELALETQQTLIEKSEERAVAQDTKIDRQSARIDEQWREIRALREEVATCHEEKRQQGVTILRQDRQIQQQEQRIRELESTA